jgi:hypothetical protein
MKHLYYVEIIDANSPRGWRVVATNVTRAVARTVMLACGGPEFARFCRM